MAGVLSVQNSFICYLTLSCRSFPCLIKNPGHILLLSHLRNIRSLSSTWNSYQLTFMLGRSSETIHESTLFHGSQRSQMPSYLEKGHRWNSLSRLPKRMGFFRSEAISLVFARGQYQRDVYGPALVPMFVRRLTPETRQAVGRLLRSMGGSDQKGAGSKGHAARAAGSLI